MPRRSQGTKNENPQSETYGPQLVAGALISPIDISAEEKAFLSKPIMSFWADIYGKFDDLRKVSALEFDILDFPECIPRAARIEWSNEPAEGDADGIMRYLGAELVNVLGRDYTNESISEMGNDILRERLTYMVKAIRSGSGPLHLITRSAVPERDFYLAETVALPLFQDGEQASAYVSATFLSPWSEHEGVIQQKFGHIGGGRL